MAEIPMLESHMPKNRMTVHDRRDQLPPVIIEALKGDILRFTQVDGDGHTHVVTLSAHHVVRPAKCDDSRAR